MAALDAWMNGEWVGTWQVHRGAHSFSYTASWLASGKSRPLSLTRTLEIKGEVVANYFDNLLPDNDRIRERIGRRFKTRSLDAFALLEAAFGDQRVLIVERFDREWMDGGRWIARLPQEDFCQALGLPPRLKYEADGGPSSAKGLALLAGSADAGTDRLAFQLAQLAFWLMAAPDGHAKNFSVFLRQLA